MTVKTIKISYGQSHFEVPSGITVQEVLVRCFGIDTNHVTYIDNPVVGLRANNELLPYSARLKTDAVIELQLLFSDLGKRMYRHTMSFLLAMASHQLFPERRLVIGHSLGDGYYFTYDGLYALESKDVDALRERMHAIVRQQLPIEREVLSYRSAVEYFTRMGFTATATLLAYRNDPNITLMRCGDYLDISYEPLVPNTSIVSLWDLHPYGDRGLLLRYPHSKNFMHLDPYRDNPKLFAVFREYKLWGNILKVDCLGAMNKICGSRDIATFIRMNEDLQHRKISEIADLVVAKGSVKVVFIAGPSSSGKTTFSKRLSIQLRLLGHDPVQISLDNYYRPKNEAPKDEEGKPDLEALEALDLDLFRENLADLYAGKAVDMPRFDFNGNGRRYFTGQKLTLKEQTVLVIEGIHGLNPSLIPGIEAKTTFKIYISALTQLNLDDHNRISTTDNRIIRRIVRDNRTRGTSAEGTLLMWPSVERGESQHIFPYQNQADVMINSALEYELAVLKPYAEPLLKTVKPESHDAYPTARRLLTFLENVYPIPADMVPSDSLLREFVGGSEFEGS
jgi:uridine kinase